MNIIRLKYHALRNEEWFGLHSEYFELATVAVADLPVIESLLPSYKVLYKEADQLLEILRKSFLVSDTTSANRHRDLAFRSLRDAVKPYLNLQNPAKQSAAEKVYAVIRKYADAIQKGSLVGKTAAIENLLQDLKGVDGGIDLSAEVQLLAIGPWVEELNEANQAYKQAHAERTDEEAERPEAGRLRQVRLELDHYYVNMVNVVDALLLAGGHNAAGEEDDEDEDEDDGPVEGRDTAPADPSEKLLQFVRQWNARLSHYKTLLKGRQTRSEKKDA
ncbi:MAG: DUF6261 family protein [Tannerellaceae bacterium]|jgi:hypothetical protein|nr:DUF6261 family protein [Tannerellaceae bacterium]